MAVTGVVGVGVSNLYSSSVETQLAQLRRREQEIVRAIRAMSGSASGDSAGSATGTDAQRAQLQTQLVEIQAQIAADESRQADSRRASAASAGSADPSGGASGFGAASGTGEHVGYHRGSLDVEA